MGAHGIVPQCGERCGLVPTIQPRAEEAGERTPVPGQQEDDAQGQQQAAHHGGRRERGAHDGRADAVVLQMEAVEDSCPALGLRLLRQQLQVECVRVQRAQDE